MSRLVSGAVRAAALLAVAAALDAQQPAKWRLVEEWRIGGAAEGANSFDFVQDIDVMPDGRIVVSDRAQQIRFYDAQGKHIRSVGGPGAGPGEYRRLRGVAVRDNGDIVASDPGNARYTALTSTGDFVRTVPYRPYSQAPWDAVIDKQGRLVEPGVRLRRGVLPFVGDAVTIRTSADLLTQDTLQVCNALPPVEERPTTRVLPVRGGSESGRGMAIYMPPFSSQRIEVARDRSGYEWIPRELGSNELVRRAHGACDVVATVKLQNRTTIPTIVRDSQLNHTVYSASEIPREYPWYDALHVDALDRLWVERRADGGGKRFEVYGVNGQAIATVDAPADFVVERRFVIASEYIIGIVKDADDVKYMVKYRAQGS